MEQALKEVETVIKEKGGTFKVVNKPQIIGDSAKDKDLDEIMKMPGEHDSNDGSSDEEDNDEGMGDIDLGEEELTGEAGLEEEDGEEGGEEGAECVAQHGSGGGLFVVASQRPRRSLGSDCPED